MRVKKEDKLRLFLLFSFLLLLFSGLVIKFYQIQILEEKKWKGVAQKQHQYLFIEPFKRGSFYSNTSIKKGHPENSQALVMDVPKVHLFADPRAIPADKKEEILKKILYTFNLNYQKAEKVRSQLYKDSRSRKLIAWLDISIEEPFLAWWRSYAKENKIPRNALFFVKDYKRSYPFGKMLGALLHTVRDEKDPHTYKSLPTGGLEMEFDQYLHGKQGRRIFYRSPRASIDMGKIIEQPQDGGDVYLTINHYLQAICEEALEKGLTRSKAKSGYVIIMDPYTGEILALAQYPYFDPENYASYFKDPEKQEYTRIKAVTDAFEPGSTFKAIMLTIGLLANVELEQRGEAPLFNPEEMIETSDGRFPKTSFKLKDGRRHNYLNMYLALQKSSNIYPGRITQRVIERLGENWLRDKLVDLFGFGYKSSIEIPAETCGLVPKPGRIHPNNRPEWSVPTPYSLAIGHNILVNGIQMTRAFAMIANGGYQVKPTIWRKIIKGDEVIENKRANMTERVLPEKVTKEIIKGLKFVTKRGGTSVKGDIPFYSEAGKSGTSEKIIRGSYSKNKYISTFIGFAPADKPRFVMMVAVDEPAPIYIDGVGKNYLGGNCAAPIFSDIGKKALEYLGVPPDDTDRTHWKEEVGEIRSLYDAWNK